MQKIKVVGGVIYPDEKGEITIPPTGSLEISLNKNIDWVSVPLQTHKKDIKTER